MSKTNIYLKIYYTEPGMSPKKIVAVVDKAQFYSLKNNFVHPLNYTGKLIQKADSFWLFWLIYMKIVHKIM
ncbi:hypothetical protein LCGC14_1854610 [marine sediment metagenome]|uniref:Uncharacterized protein n=1 Tax=marine sediment metagenome TaxID=412755 RepID=A0A0F9INX0_9ZZZZ